MFRGYCLRRVCWPVDSSKQDTCIIIVHGDNVWKERLLWPFEFCQVFMIIQMNLEICLLPPALSFSTFPFSLFWPAWHSSKDFFLKKVKAGVLFSSVGHAGIPCAEALQRTRVWLRARVPLLCVTPPLSPCFLSHSSAILSIKPERPQKKKT